MLFIEETHAAIGARIDDLEALYRDGWMPELARAGLGRLVWYCQPAHGAGLSYRVVTVTAVADGAAWEQLSAEVRGGRLAGWRREADRCRHRVDGRILAPLGCSPPLDLVGIPTEPAESAPVLYMQDTMWPRRGMADRYEEALATLLPAPARPPRSQLSVEGAYRTAPGGGTHRQVVLMQRIRDVDRLTHLLSHELPEEMEAPGSWMHEALTYRERWQSRLLRHRPVVPGAVMLVLHEAHTVIGEHAREFDHLCRDELAGRLADRRRGAAPVVLQPRGGFGSLLQRGHPHRPVRRGGPRPLGRGHRGRRARRPQPSPRRVAARGCWASSSSRSTGRRCDDLDLSSVPVDGGEHECSLYMEDTGWPSAPIDEYLAYWDTDYHRHLEAQPPERRLLRIEACFRTTLGSHRHPEGILLQKIGNLGGPEGTAHQHRALRPGSLAGFLHARRAGPAGPVGEPAAADLALVAAVLSRPVSRPPRGW